MALPIGGFMPIPLAMMIPFMATQSMVMGDAFGQAFQYGKRKISAMSNEEFNATTMEQLASQMFQAYQNIIPDLKESIKQSRSLQALIVTELLRLPVSIFQDVTGSSGDAESIRKSFQGDQPIGTVVDGKVITGYIDGVPQYRDVPSGTTSRRSPSTVQKEIPSGFQIINGKVSKIPIQTQRGKVTQKLVPAATTYKLNVQKLKIQINQSFKSYGIIVANIKNAGPLTHLVKSKELHWKKYQVLQKQLQNYLTISKNNATLKSLANADWNKKTWQPQ